MQTSQTKQPIPQIGLLDQEEHGEDENDSEYGERAQKWPCQFAQVLKLIRRFVDDPHRERTACRRRGGALAGAIRGWRRGLSVGKLVSDFLDALGRAAKRAFAGFAHRFNLVVDILLVEGQLIDDVHDLVEDYQADPCSETDHHRHHQDHGRDTPETYLLEPTHRRSQHQGQRDRESERNQNLACQVQDRNRRNHNRRGPKA